MINIQKSYSVHSIFFGPIWSYLVQMDLFSPFSPLKFDSVLFSPLRSYSVHIGSIWSTLVLFCPHWSYSVHSFHCGTTWSICPLWFYFVYFVYFGPIQSTLVQFRPLHSNFSYTVQFGPVRSIMSTLIIICPFVLIRSPLILFGPPCSYSVIFYLFGPLCFIWSNSVHSEHFGLIWSTSIYFCALT